MMVNLPMLAIVLAGLYAALVWPVWIILRRTGLNPLLIFLFPLWPLLFWIIAVSKWPACADAERRSGHVA